MELMFLKKFLLKRSLAEGKLEKLKTANLKEGLLCISRSAKYGEGQGGHGRVEGHRELHRLRKYRGGGCGNVYELPSGLKINAPASTEVILARALPNQKLWRKL